MNKFLIAAAALALSLSALPAAATTIDFDVPLPANGRTGDPIFPYSEDGFTLSDIDSGASNALFGPGAAQNHNGTPILGWLGGRAFSIASATATPFSLDFVDLSTLESQAANSYTFTGNLHGGGTISTTLNATNVWTTFSFGAGWSNLDSVSVRALNLNGAIDNIVVNAVSAPETVSLALLGLGALAAARKRRARNA